MPLKRIYLILSPFVPIILRSLQVFLSTSYVRTELLSVCSCRSANTGTSIWRGPLENDTDDFVLASSAVYRMSCSSYLQCFRGKLAYNTCFVGRCFQDLFNIACSVLVQFPSSFLSKRFVSVYEVHSYS